MRSIYLLLIAVLPLGGLLAQVDSTLLAMLEQEDQNSSKEFVRASFKTDHVINSHSLECTAGGVMDIKISHRFGFLNSGPYELFGLDNASQRIGVDYGITDRLSIGVGRSSFEKTFDGFIKYKLLWQTSGGKRNMPISLCLLAAATINTVHWAHPDRQNYFSSRMAYCYQAILGRKFSEGFSLQLMPTMIHRNLVATSAEKNDVFAIGAAARQKITKRLAINAEYYYVPANQIDPQYQNSLSLGIDLETGGHVFQLHFTNSTSMIEKGFITETVGDWLKGDIHFGFNVTRVFTVAKRHPAVPKQ